MTNPDMLEKVAQAIMKEYRTIWPRGWPVMPKAKQVAQAALSAIEEDHLVVPREPTAEMRAVCDEAEYIWAAMLAALQERGKNDG